MKKFIVLTAVFFMGVFFAQEPIKNLSKEDIPIEVANLVDISTVTFMIDTEPSFPGGMSVRDIPQGQIHPAGFAGYISVAD